MSGLTIASEVCDFRRIASASSFMAFTGLVPSEHSSGLRERRGSITKAGNAHLRRVLVEAAWSYRHKPHVRPAMSERSKGSEPASSRLLVAGAGSLARQVQSVAARKNRNVAAVAVARELAGFVWGLMNERTDAV